MKQNKEIVVGSVVAIILIGLVIWLVSAQALSRVSGSKNPTAVSTAQAASTTPVTVKTAVSAPQPYADALTLDPRDTITSWSTHVSASTAVKNKLRASIRTLSGEVGGVNRRNYNVLLQIAQDYELLSNGKSAYSFYVLAAQAVPSNGLAFSNIGYLMEQLGAYHTARSAYAASVALSPTVGQFWVSYLNFLSAHETLAPTTAAVFSAAARATNSATNVLIATANWEAAAGNTQAAITNWRLVRAKVGAAQQKAIDAKIISLQKRQ